jgi:hypothetical protein
MNAGPPPRIRLHLGLRRDRAVSTEDPDDSHKGTVAPNGQPLVWEASY